MNDGVQSKFELDALEPRTLLSVAAVNAAPSLSMDIGAVVQPLAAFHPLAVVLGKIAGTYTGSILVSGIHTQPVKVVLKEAKNGTLSGTLTTPNDPSIKVRVTGKVTSRTKFTIKLLGGHRGGSINGSGTGTIRGKTLTAKMTFVQGGRSFPGTLSLKRP
jgi:hypothetical protein